MWAYALAAILIATYTSGVKLQNEFDRFMKDHDKAYSSVEEHEKRYTIWAQNRALVQRHNEEAARGLHTYTIGINQFSDMTKEEFKKAMLTFKPAKKQTHVQSKPYGCSTLPSSIDWKAKGYVTEVGNQGSCGSCWAFTSTGALEGQHKRKTGKLVDLSEQNLLDCSSKEGNQGCCGGMMDYSFEYVKVNGGIDTESSYPYNWTDAKVGKCKYRKADSGATCTGYVDLPNGNETSLQCAVAYEGPIAVAVDASHEGFRNYKSGVYDDPQCNPQAIDFSLLVVGYGTENGKDYYNCKNSWGPTWGDHGYIKMARNKQNQCGLASMASFPTMSNNVKSIMRKRMDMAKNKGCDGIEPDNVDAYSNHNTGFHFTAADQLAYNKWLATEAHSRHLSIALKNDVDQISQLHSSFDFAINEECHQYNECSEYRPFLAEGKAVFNIEYVSHHHLSSHDTQKCTHGQPHGMKTQFKDMDVTSWAHYCPGQTTVVG